MCKIGKIEEAIKMLDCGLFYPKIRMCNSLNFNKLEVLLLVDVSEI
jgi:hypothetical protein